jgi:putative FmdB family regulatory protein
MPVYDYWCVVDGAFEQVAGRDCTSQPCPACGSDARRLLSVPHLKGQTVVKSIPDPLYRADAALRASRASGWDVDRAVRTMRKGMRTDEQGNQSVSARG